MACFYKITNAFLFLSASLITTGTYATEAYPKQPIKMVVPYPAGGTTDLMARLYAEGLAKELKQPVIIDNKGGAATNIGSGVVAQASPDGYTILFGTIGPFLNTVLGPEPTFDPFTKLEIVASVVRLSYMLAANPKTPFSNVSELLSEAKKQPGTFTVGSAQLHHYVGLMNNKSKLDILHVPYKGGNEAATAAIGGQLDMVYALVPLLKPHVESGALKAIGVTSKQRTPSMPATGTFLEAGTEFTLTSWFGLLVPAGTPEPIQSKLGAATKSVVTNPEFVERIAKLGAQADWSDGAAMKAELNDSMNMWRSFLKDAPLLASKAK